MKKPARPVKPAKPVRKAPAGKQPHPAAHHPGHRNAPPAKGAPPSPALRHHRKPAKPVAKKHPVRKLALGEGVACCSAEALAASLRLAGVPVGDEDVLALYWHTASDVDAGASIMATLEAASEFGLAGCTPVFSARDPEQVFLSPQVILGVMLPGGPHALTADPSGAVWSWGELYDLPQLGPGTIDEAWTVTW